MAITLSESFIVKCVKALFESHFPGYLSATLVKHGSNYQFMLGKDIVFSFTIICLTNKISLYLNSYDLDPIDFYSMANALDKKFEKVLDISID